MIEIVLPALLLLGWIVVPFVRQMVVALLLSMFCGVLAGAGLFLLGGGQSDQFILVVAGVPAATALFFMMWPIGKPLRSMMRRHRARYA